MKMISTLKFLTVCSLFVMGTTLSLSASEYHAESDTIILEFGNNSKILVLIDGKEDLKSLQNYDINQMLKDIAVSIDSAEGEVDYLTIEDNEGDRYLQDTTIVVRNKNTVKESNGNSVSIKIANYEIATDDLENLEGDIEDPLEFSSYEKSERIEKRTWGTRHSFNIEIGLNNWLEDGNFPAGNAQYNVKPWGSWFLGFSSTYKTSLGGPFFLNWGGDIAYFNWKFEDRDTRLTKEDTEVVFSADNTVDGRKSKLAATYINAHFVPMIDFSYGSRQVKTLEKGSLRVTKYKKRSFRIGAGGYAGYRLASRTRIVYEEDGDREKETNKGNFFLNNFRYGIRGQMGYKGFDFFVNYDLNNLFQDDRGPELNAISFGIIL